MRFLIVTKAKHPMPPSPGLVDALNAWVEQHRGTGKMEQSWSFAGLAGGGGILDVASLEELDEIMTGFPFGPFSEIEVYPLVDLHASLERLKESMQAMAGAFGGGA